MKKDWVVSIKNQCRYARVPFFFKQWGGVRKAAAGRLLQGRTYDEFPQRFQHPVPDARERISLAQDIEASCMNHRPQSSLDSFALPRTNI